MTSVGLSERIAGYRLDELAGRGGMGVVYRATDLRLERTVALKVIAPALASDPVFRERFQREARLLAAIDHPHVIPFFEADEADGQLFLSMRWVEGCSLADVIHNSGGLEPTRALSIVSQIAGALDAVHAHGLVHRDLKPGNVLLENRDGEEHAYLTDFGAGRALDGPSEVTGTGQWLGSVDYIAPETLSGSRASAHSDIYALGSVLFEALTGTPPFHRDTQLATLWAHQRDPPPSVCARRPALPAPVDAVLARALAKDPDVRYQNAERLAEAFGDALLVARGVETLPPQPAHPRPADPRRAVYGNSEQILPAPSPELAPETQLVAPRRRARRQIFAELVRRVVPRRPRRRRLPAVRQRLIVASVLAAALVYLASQLLAAAPGARTHHPPRLTGSVPSAGTHRAAAPKAPRASPHKQVIRHRRTRSRVRQRTRATHHAGSPSQTGAGAVAQTQPASTSTGSAYTASPVSTPNPPATSTSSSGASVASVGAPSGSAPFGPGYPGK